MTGGPAVSQSVLDLARMLQPLAHHLIGVCPRDAIRDGSTQAASRAEVLEIP
jgi:hypothetical protein